MRNLCNIITNLYSILVRSSFIILNYKAIRLLNYILVFSVVFSLNNNSYSYPNNRPTNEAIAIDIASCAPMWGTMATCLIAYKSGGSALKRAAVCGAAVAVYGGARNLQEGLANDFKNGSYVANHQDLDGNGLNDYALLRTQDCKALLEPSPVNVPKILVEDNGNVHRVSASGNYDGPGDIANLGFLDEQYTEEMVLGLPGCNKDSSGEIVGDTYELFDPEKNLNDTLDELCMGVRVSYDGDEKCILEDDCLWLGSGTSRKLVCAYEVDDMICTEGVFCSMNIAGIDYEGGAWGGLAEPLSNFFDFSDIDARVDDGVDGYGDDGNSEVIECKDICEIGNDADNGRFIANYNGPDVNGETISKSAGDTDCFSSIACDKCYDESVCIDEVNAKKIDDCDPSTDESNARVCGYIFNPKYLAHCVPKPYMAYQGDYVFPQVISPHCTGDAVVRDGDGEMKQSFAGRAMRCIDQTMKNMFYGTYNIVGEYINPVNNKIIPDQVVGIGCLSDSASYVVISDPAECVNGSVSNIQGELRCNYYTNTGAVVSSPSDCDNGLFVRFQNFAEGTVTVILVVAVFCIGLLVLYGLLDNLRMVLKYVLVLGIVLYFVKGDAWRDGYFDFIMESGTEFGMMVFNALDFGEVDTSDSQYAGMNVELPSEVKCVSEDEGYGPNNIIYPISDVANKSLESKYMVWDMYDCRTANFFGWGGFGDAFLSFLRNSIFSLFAFVLIAIIIGPVTILVYIYVLLKCLFMITSTMIVITLLVFISPLIIPLVLFTNQKARGIFDNWLKHLVGYSMVPLILFVVLGLFFKVIDSSIYGANVGDVYHVVDGQTVIDPECREIFIPCFIYNMENGKYEGNRNLLGIPIPWVGQEGMIAFIKAALRLFFVFIVMLLVFSFITTSLISGLLGVSVMEDSVFSGMKDGLKGAGKIGVGALTRGKHAAGKVAKKLSGRNDNDYGTK